MTRRREILATSAMALLCARVGGWLARQENHRGTRGAAV